MPRSKNRFDISPLVTTCRHSESVNTRVLRRIESQGPGRVLTPQDFGELGTRTAVATALKRHKAADTVPQLGRVLYDVPRLHRVLGTLWPDIDTISQQLARKDGLRLQPTGVHAANLLGLSEQVPAKVVFLTDGATRTVRLGPRKSRSSAQAERPLDPGAAQHRAGNVTPRQVAELRERLPAAQRAEILTTCTPHRCGCMRICARR